MRITGLALGGLGIAVVLAAAGCTSSGSKPSASASFVAPVSASVAPPWTEPSAYTYVLTRGCDDSKPLAKYAVTVQGGTVASSKRLDRTEAQPSASDDADLGPVGGDDGEEMEVPTLGGLLDIVQTAADDGGEVSRTYDATDGHPVKVMFNTSDSGAASEAECFSVTNYTITK